MLQRLHEKLGLTKTTRFAGLNVRSKVVGTIVRRVLVWVSEKLTDFQKKKHEMSAVMLFLAAICISVETKNNCETILTY